jgi:hypothetical protein
MRAYTQCTRRRNFPLGLPLNALQIYNKESLTINESENKNKRKSPRIIEKPCRDFSIKFVTN